MRFTTPIYFQKLEIGEYDPKSGDYKADTVTETKRYANVTSAGIESLKMIYGTLKQGSLVIRLQNHYKEPFDYIRIGDARYRVDFERKLDVKQAFIVSEVQ